MSFPFRQMPQATLGPGENVFILTDVRFLQMQTLAHEAKGRCVPKLTLYIRNLTNFESYVRLTVDGSTGGIKVPKRGTVEIGEYEWPVDTTLQIETLAGGGAIVVPLLVV